MKPPEREKAVVFQLLEGDIQDVAGEQIGRRLTKDELRRVQRIVDKRFDYWYEFLCEAVREVTEDGT